jgi:phage gpG-like protein
MPVTGDFAKLKRLIGKLRKVENRELHRAISKQVAEESLLLIADGFRSETDPYGKSWLPWGTIVHRQGKILSDTGHLRRFAIREVTERGFVVHSTAKYGQYHQRGTRYLRIRQMVPERKLPPDWARAFHETILEVIRDVLKG